MGYDGEFPDVEFLEEDGFLDFSALMRAAVYALVRRGEVVYVGQSVEPLVRLNTHRAGWFRKPKAVMRTRGVIFDEVWIRPCQPFNLDEVEQELIRKYQPKYNVRHKPKPTPPDLEEIMRVLIPATPYPIALPEPRSYIRRRL